MLGLAAMNWVLSGFSAVVIAIFVLGALQFTYFVVSGGIPGTGFYYARRLRDGNAQVRQEAVKDLVERGDVFAFGLLVKALEDRDLAIRVTAIEGLGNFRSTLIIEPLLKFLRDRSLVVRIKTIEAIGKVPSAEIGPVLVEVLRDSDARAKLVALRIFKDLRDPVALPAIARLVLESDEQVHHAAVGVLQHYGTESVRQLASLLPDATDGAKRVVKAMLEIDRAACYDPLKEVLATATDPHVLKETLEALTSSGRPGTADFLLPYMTDPAFPAREGVVEALPQLRDPVCVMPLCHLLSDQDVRIRRKAATALDMLVTLCRDYEVVDPLCAALIDADPEIRHYAARALGRIGGQLIQEKVIRTMWGEHAQPVIAFIEGIVGYSMNRMVSFDELLLALDRVMTSQRLTEESLRCIDLMESLMIVLHGANVRGQRVDDKTLDLLIRGRRTYYPLRMYELHPLAANLLEFVTTKTEGDRWRVSSIA